MFGFIQKIRAQRAEQRAFEQLLDERLTDKHFFTVAEFARNFEFNTGRLVTTNEVTELRALLGE